MQLNGIGMTATNMDPLGCKLSTSNLEYPLAGSLMTHALTHTWKMQPIGSICTNTSCLAQSLLAPPPLLDNELEDMPICDNLLAHVIGNDEMIVGSGLEGAVFTKSMALAARELGRLSDGRYVTGAHDIEKTEAAGMVGQLHASGAMLTQLYDLAPLPIAQQQKGVREICKNLIREITELAPTKRILLPGGWTGKPGHAMLYEVEKQLDGQIIFHLYNSGDGLNYHPKRQDERSADTKHLCHLQWSLGTQASSESILKQLLPELLELRALGKSGSWDSGAKQLYEGIIPRMETLGGKRYIPHPKDPCWMRHQKAGICTWRSIEIWKKAHLSPATHRLMKLCTKVQLLHEHAHQHPQNAQKNTVISNLCKKALEKIAAGRDAHNITSVAIPVVETPATPPPRLWRSRIHLSSRAWRRDPIDYGKISLAHKPSGEDNPLHRLHLSWLTDPSIQDFWRQLWRQFLKFLNTQKQENSPH